MADQLADAIYRSLTGRRSGALRPSFTEALRELIDYRAQTGMSRRAMSRMSGIPETTLRRWDGGARPTERDHDRQYGRLLSLYRHISVSPAVEQRWANNQISITIDGFPAKGGSGRTETRVLDAQRLRLSPGTGEDVLERFYAGDDRGAARAFVAGIGDDWYHDVVFAGWLTELAYEGHGVDGDYALSVSAG